jgi:cytochrome c553
MLSPALACIVMMLRMSQCTAEQKVSKAITCSRQKQVADVVICTVLHVATCGKCHGAQLSTTHHQPSLHKADSSSKKADQQTKVLWSTPMDEK